MTRMYQEHRCGLENGLPGPFYDNTHWRQAMNDRTLRLGLGKQGAAPDASVSPSHTESSTSRHHVNGHDEPSLAPAKTTAGDPSRPLTWWVKACAKPRSAMAKDDGSGGRRKRTTKLWPLGQTPTADTLLPAVPLPRHHWPRQLFLVCGWLAIDFRQKTCLQST